MLIFSPEAKLLVHDFEVICGVSHQADFKSLARAGKFDTEVCIHTPALAILLSPYFSLNHRLKFSFHRVNKRRICCPSFLKTFWQECCLLNIVQPYSTMKISTFMDGLLIATFGFS